MNNLIDQRLMVISVSEVYKLPLLMKVI